ncbi:hypothetical protein ACRALDRAFT_205079 [Sodiomyces alcalophilus JCM 7366]|uniref:uncharacterized protein n=1 Tax=Sodiomyces alcalophilus JCM 7366 TaxID=591952 RepID=UPI0039B4F166
MSVTASAASPALAFSCAIPWHLMTRRPTLSPGLLTAMPSLTRLDLNNLYELSDRPWICRGQHEHLFEARLPSFG